MTNCWRELGFPLWKNELVGHLTGSKVEWVHFSLHSQENDLFREQRVKCISHFLISSSNKNHEVISKILICFHGDNFLKYT